MKRAFKEETNLTIEVGNHLAGRIETPDRTKLVITFEVTFSQGEIKTQSKNTVGSARFPVTAFYNYAVYLQKYASA